MIARLYRGSLLGPCLTPPGNSNSYEVTRRIYRRNKRAKVKVLVPVGVEVPERMAGYTLANMQRIEGSDRVAVCVGLSKAVRGCWWEVVSVHTRGETQPAEIAAKQTEQGRTYGTALVFLDDTDETELVFA